MIAGQLTASELALLRTRPQRTQLYLAIPQYHTIYTARTDGAPADNDNIISVDFDGGAGTLANVLPGMTLLVGSAAGLWDIGIARIRDDPLDTGGGTGVFSIGITSEIEWADDLYLTVLDDYGLWPKHPRITAGVSYIDYNIAYTNQNVYGAPVPIIGTHRVLELTGAGVTAHFDASDTYNCIGTPPSYDVAWYVDNVLAANAAATDITFTSPGTYVIRCEISTNFSFSIAQPESIAVRYVIVYDKEHPLNASFTLDSCSGSYDQGGWSYHVTVNANATQATIRDRALCLLVARDWYGSTEQSIGPIEDAENIVCVGWIDGESIRRSNDRSLVTFDVQGPAFWLEVQEGFPTGIDDTNAAPTDWLHIQSLDPRKGLFSFLHWRTTATVVTDCYITSDDHRLATTYTPAGSLMEQLRAIAQRVQAKAVCDRYGRLYCEIDTQFVPTISRTFAVVQTMVDRDWRDEITIERRIVPEAGQVDLSGVYYSGNFATSNAIFSLSPGHYPKHYGHKQKVERIALDDQAEANFLAGAWLAYLNNEFPHVDTPMSSNYRAVDIAPRMFVQQNLAAGDTPRRLVWTNKKLIPREVSFNYDPRNALLLTDIDFEAETFASDAVTGDPPIEPPDPPPPPPPPVLCDDPDALNFGEPGECIYRTLTDVVIVFNATQLARSLDFYGALPPTWENIKTSSLAGANVGNILNCAVSSGAAAWALTYKDEATLGDNGVFYCSNVLAATPTWNLICSVATYRGLGYTGYPIALGVDSNGIFYTQSSHQVYGYGTASVTWRTSTNPPPTRETINMQYSVGVSAGQARGTHSGAATPGKAIITMDGATDTLVCYTTTFGAPPWFPGVSGNFVIVGAGVADDLYSYTDSPILNGSVFTLIYNGVDWRSGLCSDGVNVLSVRESDTYLMVGAVALAAPTTVFGALGGGGGFCFGLAGYGEVIWTNRTPAPATNLCIALRDTGGTWTDKTGDFIIAIGAWAGFVSNIMPVPLTISV